MYISTPSVMINRMSDFLGERMYISTPYVMINSMSDYCRRMYVHVNTVCDD
jgi:chemotaxis protein CheY-P-specific phosphatase CheC